MEVEAELEEESLKVLEEQELAAAEVEVPELPEEEEEAAAASPAKVVEVEAWERLDSSAVAVVTDRPACTWAVSVRI